MAPLLAHVPKPGRRFKIGRTPVNCAASDTRGNTQSATFRITVRAQR
jgi:HYR domain-containing protein